MENCNVCNTKKLECDYCETKVCVRCNLHLKFRGVVHCEDCNKLLCQKCKRIKNGCMRCNLTHCSKCEDGYSYSCWGDCDIYYCKKCREMTVEELYNYIVETYKEKLTLKEIRDLILQ